MSGIVDEVAISASKHVLTVTQSKTMTMTVTMTKDKECYAICDMVCAVSMWHAMAYGCYSPVLYQCYDDRVALLKHNGTTNNTGRP